MLTTVALLIAAGATDIALPRSFGSAPHEQQRPAAAWSSSARLWLTAWNEASARGSVLGARVDDEGRVLDRPGRVLDAGVFKMEATPRVASCGDTFVVVFNAHEERPVVKARRVDARSGRALDAAPLLVSPAGMDARAPDVACDEKRGVAVVLWQVYGSGGVSARTLDARSGELGQVAALEPGAPRKRHTTSAALIFDGAAFRALWRTRLGPTADSDLHTARFRVPLDAEAHDLGTAQTSHFDLLAAPLPRGGFALVHQAIVDDPRRQPPQPTRRTRWLVWRFAGDGAKQEIALPVDEVSVYAVASAGGDLVIGAQRFSGEPTGPRLMRVPAAANSEADVEIAAPLLALPPLEQTDATRGCAICKAQWRLGGAALSSGGGTMLALWTDAVPIESSPAGPIPQQAIDVDVRGVRVDVEALVPLDQPAAALRISTGDALRRLPRAALRKGRGAVSWIEGAAKALRVARVDVASGTAGAALDLGPVRRELHDVAPLVDGGFVLAWDAQDGTRLARIDQASRLVGRPVTRPLARHFALAFDGATPWLALTDERAVIVLRLGGDLEPLGDPVVFRTDLPVDRVALACRAPGDCAVAFADGHNRIHLGLVAARLAGGARAATARVVAEGGGPTLAARDGGWVVGVVTERQARLLRFDGDGNPAGEECASCGVPQVAAEGPGVPVLGRNGALFDVGRDGRRFVAGRQGWFHNADHGIGAYPAAAVDGARALEVWQSGDGIRVRLVE